MTLAQMTRDTLAVPSTASAQRNTLRVIRALAPFSQQEIARLQFVRWLYQTGRIRG